MLSSARECSVRDICQAVEDATDIDKNLQLKIALMGDGEVVVTPCRGPPAPEAVKAWARDKLTKRGLKKQGTDPALEKSEPSQENANDGNLENPEKNQLLEQRKTDSDVSKPFKIELEQVIPENSTPNIPSQEVAAQFKASTVDAEFEPLVDKHKALDEVKGEQKMDVMELSDSPSPVEMTSPCSLFSPNKRQIFTFASGTPKDTVQCKPVKDTHTENALTGTQPMNIDKALTLSAQNDEHVSEQEDFVTSETSPVTVTPSVPPSPCGTPGPSTTKQPLSPILQSQSPVFAAPYHSTPVATKLVYGVQSPRCTPITDAAKAKRLENNAETSRKSLLGHQASSDQTPSLRQQLLASQFKVILSLCFFLRQLSTRNMSFMFRLHVAFFFACSSSLLALNRGAKCRGAHRSKVPLLTTPTGLRSLR